LQTFDQETNRPSVPPDRLLAFTPPLPTESSFDAVWVNKATLRVTFTSLGVLPPTPANATNGTACSEYGPFGIVGSEVSVVALLGCVIGDGVACPVGVCSE
jgi:hypothetical protein